MSELTNILPSEMPWLPIALAILVLGLALLVVVRFVGGLLGRKKPGRSEDIDLTIDIAKLAATGPPANAPRLEILHTPMRLAAIVVAPAGRSGLLPDLAHLGAMVDAIAPGMKAVVDAHLPLVRRWPAQLSAQGFANSFFSHAELPGDGGKGSPWCAVAGSFKHQGNRFLVGMICRADGPNGIGQITVPREEAWLEVARVKS
ncbi:MAG: hypothetical protein KDA42_15020 [Planctomycetales bacterium]|nr:hypothetical protein [Planctomycetales bacterium]